MSATVPRMCALGGGVGVTVAGLGDWLTLGERGRAQALPGRPFSGHGALSLSLPGSGPQLPRDSGWGAPGPGQQWGMHPMAPPCLPPSPKRPGLSGGHPLSVITCCTMGFRL